MQTTSEPLAQTEEVCVGRLDEIPPGSARSFTVRGRPVAVFHLPGGEVRATDNRCPHCGGPLVEGSRAGGKVACPSLGYRFEIATGRSESNHICDVATVPVSVRNGRVYLTVAAPAPVSAPSDCWRGG
jgi:nitrite reductase (NADH) small subunit